MEQHCGWARKILFHGGLFGFTFRLGFSVDSDLEERDLEDEENEITDDVILLTFTNVLQRAQEITEEEENKKWGERKRPKRYTKTVKFFPIYTSLRSKVKDK